MVKLNIMSDDRLNNCFVIALKKYMGKPKHARSYLILKYDKD